MNYRQDFISLSEAYTRVYRNPVINEAYHLPYTGPAELTAEELQQAKTLVEIMKLHVKDPTDKYGNDALNKAFADLYKLAATTPAVPAQAPKTADKPSVTVTPPSATAEPAPTKSVPLSDAQADQMAAEEPNAYVAPKTTAQPQPPAVTTFNNKNIPTTTTDNQQAVKDIQPPTDEEKAEFKRQTGTSFNPTSVNDKLSLQRMRQGQQTFNSKQANAYRKSHPNWKPGSAV